MFDAANIDEIVAEIRRRREERHHDMLATYVGRLPGYDYETASELPTAKLEELFEEDDWATDLGYEASDAIEQDEGYIRAMNEVLVLIGAEPTQPTE